MKIPHWSIGPTEIGRCTHCDREAERAAGGFWWHNTSSLVVCKKPQFRSAFR